MSGWSPTQTLEILDFSAFLWYHLIMEKMMETLTKEELIENILKLQSELSEKQSEYDKLQKENLRLSENFEKLRHMLFGQSSEKRRFIEDADQLSFMKRIINEAEVFAKDAGKEELSEIKVPGHTRKPKRTREELLASLPSIEILIDTEEESRICDACGSKTRYLGKEHVRDEIEIIPQKMYMKRYFRANYVCEECHKEETQARIIKSNVPEPVIKHSLASASAVAHVMYQRYVNAMPIARQEKDWCYQGVQVGRATLGNWVLKSAKEHLFPLYELMKEELLSGAVIAADETDIQVLKEKDRLPSAMSKMWVYRSISRSVDREGSPPIILFEYQPGRSGEYAKNFLRGFKGYLMSDAYQGYNAVPDVTHCYCWSHMRRYWHRALPKNPKGSKAKIGLAFCDKLFELERQWKELPAAERYLERNQHAKFFLDAYFRWVESLNVLEGSGLGKAVNYAMNNKSGLLGYLADGRVELSTNWIEGNIRKFVIGRKNFIAVDTVAGAKASAVCYSIALSAMENGLNVYEYLKYLFQELPKRRKDKDDFLLENCLPWSKTLPPECYLNSKSESDSSEQLKISST
jgi:transposase